MGFLRARSMACLPGRAYARGSDVIVDKLHAPSKAGTGHLIPKRHLTAVFARTPKGTGLLRREDSLWYYLHAQ